MSSLVKLPGGNTRSVVAVVCPHVVAGKFATSTICRTLCAVAPGASFTVRLAAPVSRPAAEPSCDDDRADTPGYPSSVHDALPVLVNSTGTYVDPAAAP